MFMVMKIGLIGYGHMGKEVESIALSKAHEISFIIDESNLADLNAGVLTRADVIIEFTRPDSAFINILACLNAGVPVVSGTTGWLERFDEIKKTCISLNGSLFYASNFSIGVNLFFELNAKLARLMKEYPNYSVRIEETHHTRKKDAPSGTALTLVNQIISENGNLSGWTNELVAAQDQISVTSIREGNVPGTHSVQYLSGEDKISIRHEAFSRKGMAAGALAAAEFLASRKGIYTMNDLINNKNLV
jgi:4-hydroxy-tetrahydrodipicolinate reductase